MAKARIVMSGTKIDFTPIGAQVAFKPHKRTETAKGVLLPESVQGGMSDVDQIPSGTVLAVGPDVKMVKVGDVIAAPSGAPVIRVKWRNVEFYMTNEDEILGVIEDNVK